MNETNLDLLKQQICDIGQRGYQKGFAAANEGNISARAGDDRVLCTPTLTCKGFMTPDDICTVDMDGNQAHHLDSRHQCHSIQYRAANSARDRAHRWHQRRRHQGYLTCTCCRHSAKTTVCRTVSVAFASLLARSQLLPLGGVCSPDALNLYRRDLMGLVADDRPKRVQQRK